MDVIYISKKGKHMNTKDMYRAAYQITVKWVCLHHYTKHYTRWANWYKWQVMPSA